MKVKDAGPFAPAPSRKEALEFHCGTAFASRPMSEPACPMGEMILEDAQHALETLAPAGLEVDLALVWDPPWTPDRMSEHARAHFGWK